MCPLKPLLNLPWVTLLDSQLFFTEQTTVIGQFILKIQMPAKCLSESRKSVSSTLWESISYTEVVWKLWVVLCKLKAALSPSPSQASFPPLPLLQVAPWWGLLSSPTPFLWPRVCCSSLLPSTSKGLAAPGMQEQRERRMKVCWCCGGRERKERSMALSACCQREGLKIPSAAAGRGGLNRVKSCSKHPAPHSWQWPKLGQVSSWCWQNGACLLCHRQWGCLAHDSHFPPQATAGFAHSLNGPLCFLFHFLPSEINVVYHEGP